MTRRPVAPDSLIEVTIRRLENGRYLATALQFRFPRALRTVARTCGLLDFPEHPNGFDTADAATEAGRALGLQLLHNGEVC